MESTTMSSGVVPRGQYVLFHSILLLLNRKNVESTYYFSFIFLEYRFIGRHFIKRF